jgi:hypothetical protein
VLKKQQQKKKRDFTLLFFWFGVSIRIELVIMWGQKKNTENSNNNVVVVVAYDVQASSTFWTWNRGAGNIEREKETEGGVSFVGRARRSSTTTHPMG